MEREVLSISDSPWLVKLLYSFQDPRYLYLAMVHETTCTGGSSQNRPNVKPFPAAWLGPNQEYVPGGDLRSLLHIFGPDRIFTDVGIVCFADFLFCRLVVNLSHHQAHSRRMPRPPTRQRCLRLLPPCTRSIFFTGRGLP